MQAVICVRHPSYGHIAVRKPLFDFSIHRIRPRQHLAQRRTFKCKTLVYFSARHEKAADFILSQETEGMIRKCGTESSHGWKCKQHIAQRSGMHDK